MRQALALPAVSDAGDTSELSTVARLTAAARMKLQDADAARATALRYRLLSPWTNWFVVAARADGAKAEDLPQLRTVAHTLAAGWGGTGRLGAHPPGTLLESFMSLGAVRPARNLRMRMDIGADHALERAVEFREYLRPAFDWQEAHRQLLELIAADAAKLDQLNIVDLLYAAGFGRKFANLLIFARRRGLASSAVAAILLERLLAGALGSGLSTEARAAYEVVCAHGE